MPETVQPRGDAAARASILSVCLLALTFVAGAFAFLLPVIYKLVPGVALPPPLASQHQPAENLLYLLSFFVILPVAIFVSARIADRIQARSGGVNVVPALAGVLAAGLVAVAALTRLSVHVSWGGGLRTLFVLAAIWVLLALAALALAWQGRARRLFAGLADSPALAAAGAVLVVVLALSLTDSSHIDLRALLVGLAVAAVITWLYGRHELRRMGRRWGIVFDLVVFVLVLLAVPDMVIYRVGDFATGPDDLFGAYIQQFHGALFLGAVSQLNAGGTLLVDVVSQYGVGSIYFLAAVFKVLPIGYGTLSITDGMLSGFVFACGYSILRMTGVNRLLAAGSMAFAVVVLIYGTTYPIGGLLQHGAIRFGLLPVSLITMRMASYRWQKTSRLTAAVAWLIIGLSSVWALEAFIYVTATFAGLTLVESTWQPRQERLRWILGQVARAAMAWIAIQVIFALATLVASGDLPNWGQYFTYVRDFLGGSVGDLTYDFVPFSPALLVAGGYAASAVLLLVNLWRNESWTDRHRLAMLAVGGLTAYGVAVYSYFDNRSLAHILPYVSLPLLLSTVIWLSLLLADTERFSLQLRRLVLGTALVVAALCVSVVWPAAGHRAKDSVLAYAIPGGKSLRGGFDRLGNLPPIVSGADVGQALIEKYMPDESETAIITKPDLDTNILVLADRANSLGITDAKEDSWVPGPHEPVVDKAVAALRPGDRILMDQAALAAFNQIRRHPRTNRTALTQDTEIAGIDLRILHQIERRFDLKTVATGAGGLTVVSLEPRKS